MHAVENKSDGADGNVAGDDVGSIAVARGETAEPRVESLSSGDGDLNEAARREKREETKIATRCKGGE